MNIYKASLADTKYLFFAGKGGVGKTSLAASTAVALADQGKRILIVSTDPASNLQDVYEQPIGIHPTPIKEVVGLDAVNLDPLKSAKEYRDSVIAPYIGKLPESAIENMKEQLSGSCTVEIASFNAFASFLSDDAYAEKYDRIIFDTAPTGHTLRLLELPAAWSGFISDSNLGASCLGQLSGLGEKRNSYEKAMKTLKDENLTTMIYVARADDSLQEAVRAAKELAKVGIASHHLVINAWLDASGDSSLRDAAEKQNELVKEADRDFAKISYLPLRGYEVVGIRGLRHLLNDGTIEETEAHETALPSFKFSALIDDMLSTKKKIIMMMGKGGVGKTHLAIKIALALIERGKKVTLASTDPADRISAMLKEQKNLSLRHIDESKELQNYQNEVTAKAKAAGIGQAELAYIEEDLRSPCTQEIATFRAFANIVEESEGSIAVIDTAPTGHTLLLLNSAEAYNREIKNNGGETTPALKKLLPRLQSSETSIVIVALPEQTPIFEASRLQDDLDRGSLPHKWWIVNRSYLLANCSEKLFRIKGKQEIHWINEANRLANGNVVVEPFSR